MNEQPIVESHDRPALAARFSARVSRFRASLRRRWWMFPLVVGLAMLVQFALIEFAPRTFTSLGRMIVSIKLAIPEGSLYTEELSNFLGTQATLMQSGTVINRAHARVTAQKPDLMLQPVDLQVSVTPKTTIFVLRAIGGDPRYTQAFLAACMEEYINLKKEMREQTSATTLSGLTEEVLRLEKDLRKCDEEMAAFQGSNSVVLLQEQGNSAGAYLAALNQRFAGLKSEYDLLGSITSDDDLRRAGNGTAEAEPAGTTSGNSPPGGGILADTQFQKAKQEIAVLKAEMAELGQFLRPKHPKVIAMTDEIARRERLLEIYRKQNLDDMENRKRLLALQIKNMEKDVKEWDAKNLEISRKTAEYQRLKSNAQRIQALYERLLSTMRTLDVNKEINPESVTIMEPACAAFPTRPRLGLALLKAGLIGLGLCFALVLLIDRLDDRVSSFTELQELFDETILGQIPRERRLAKGAHLPLIQKDDQRHPFVESYRNLRSSILYLSEAGKRPRTMVITSAVPNEGKSMTASNLAITMALSGARVLMVDADMRKGLLHARFGLQPEPGLSEVLTAGLEWTQAVQPTSVANLFLLPRGATTQNASELFLHESTARLLKAAAERYDCVLIDTAPVMAADDVTTLAPLVDGVIFVLRAEHTSARVAHAALDLLYQRRAHVLGFVFNAVRSTAGDYYYYYRYRDYYKSYPSK